MKEHVNLNNKNKICKNQQQNRITQIKSKKKEVSLRKEN